MRNFWALPAAFRLILASQQSFSVQDDLLAFPQYAIQFLDRLIPESHAVSRLSKSAKDPIAETKETQELSHGGHVSGGGTLEEDGDNGDLLASYERMVLDDQDYLCRIPFVAPPVPLNETEAKASAEEEEKELMRATDRGWELLRGMQDDCIYFISGWWSYSFCYNKEVKQFHQLPPSKGVPIYPPVEDQSVHSFVLGRFPSKKGAKQKVQVDDEETKEESVEEKGLTKLETKGETRYMVQRLGGGTECDLTGKDRKIEVQFHCHPNSADRIGMIKEVSTCSYLMVIHTPRLCNDVAFLPPQKDKPNAITCTPIVADEDFEELNTALEAEKNQEKLQIESPPSTVSPRPIIGGIPVGAQQLVGKPGREIEKSVVVGGGKETTLAVVATSDGKQLSERDMRKLDITNPKDVETLKRNIRKLAGGKDWRLELVETPRGKEFRAVIETEGDEEKEQGENEESAEGSEEVYQEEL